jgi:thiosulfate/3-mercaptopyruvate sulfurtransferase
MNLLKQRSLFILVFALTLLVVSGCVAQPIVPEAAAEAGAEAATQTESEVVADESEAVAESAPAAEARVGYENVVVTTEWLAENLDNPNVRIIEVSVVPGVYERGHIPGAVNFVWHTDFVDTVTRDIISQERFQELVRAAGINNDSTVILYGDNNNWFAAWGVWVFKTYGAEDVRLLDGGRVKWEAEGRELAVAPAEVAPGDFVASEPNTNLRARLPEVLAVAQEELDYHLIDIRGPAEYEGQIFAPEGVQELSVRAGHIPTAVNVPWAQAVKEDGTFKSVEELRELYASVGVDGSKPIIVYCRIGERASHTWFVLTQILGYEAKLYDGSWTEWGNTVGVPIVNPAGTIWGAQ